MSHYKAPLRDMRFVMFELLDAEREFHLIQSEKHQHMQQDGDKHRRRRPATEVFGSREAVGVDSIAIGFVVLFVAWIIDKEGIRSRGTPNDNAIHGVSLMFGPFDVAVLLMMEIAKRKERNPRPLVMANTMDE